MKKEVQEVIVKQLDINHRMCKKQIALNDEVLIAIKLIWLAVGVLFLLYISLIVILKFL